MCPVPSPGTVIVGVTITFGKVKSAHHTITITQSSTKRVVTISDATVDDGNRLISSTKPKLVLHLSETCLAVSTCQRKLKILQLLLKANVIIGGKPKVRIPFEVMLQVLVFGYPLLVEQPVMKHCWNR